MIGATGPYAELFVILLCWVILNPIFLTMYFYKKITERFNSQIKKTIALFTLYILLLFIAVLSFRLTFIIRLIPSLIISLTSTITLVFMLGLRNDKIKQIQ